MTSPRPADPSPILRLETDPGLLTNRRLALEVGVGLAHLTGRRLSMPWHDRIGASPGSRPASDGAPDVRPRVTDLWHVPVELVTDEEWEEHAGAARELDWGPFTQCVYLGDADPVPHAGITDFANGRTRFVRLPDDDTALSVLGRPLSFPSYFFHATGATRRDLFAAISAVRLRPAYLDLADRIASGLPRANVAHVRRTDLVKGIRAYAGVPPTLIAENLAAILPTDELLLIATEADPASSLFDPIRQRFAQVEFISDLILHDHADAFGALEYHEDNALGAITQEIAARAERFVGTIGSTFTGLIQRRRCERDPLAPFVYTADYTPAGPVFADGIYRDRRPGRYSWNRVALALSPDVCAWLREWPEAVSSPDDQVETTPDRRAERAHPIHAVVCTDTNPYGHWQCEFQEHTWARVRQPGELVRLVGRPDGESTPTMRHARVVGTAARNTHPDAPEEYAGFNRLWSLQEWLEREQVTGSVLILDSDFVFRSPVRTVATPGVVTVQEWYGPGLVEALRHRLAPLTDVDPDRIAPVTWPLVIDAGDLARILPRWLELTAALRRTTGMWESDMVALVGALAEDGIEVRYETLGAWMDWPEEFVAGAPIIHYCQEVKDRTGAPMWFKQRYRPWEPIDCDPNDAALDYCRDLLHLLDEYLRTRTVPSEVAVSERAVDEHHRSDPRIAVVVVGCLRPPFDRCVATIRATWAARPPEGVDVFYAYGGHTSPTGADREVLEAMLGGPPPELDDGDVWASGDILVCGCADVWEEQLSCVLRKRLAAFGHLARDRSYDFVHTVCASSYVDLARLKEYDAGLPTRVGVYHGGRLVHEPTGYPFVSGASLLCSGDVAAELANHGRRVLARYPESLPDDVVIGHFVATNYSSRPFEEIARRIAAGVRATDDQTFVLPYGHGSVDYVMTPVADQVPHESTYHYHFHSGRIWELEIFHRRHVATDTERGSGPQGVLVTGMHRSGTSAATRVLNFLGLAMCRPFDLIPAAPGNERGHWESSSLSSLNEDLLNRMDSAWWCPPRSDEVIRWSAQATDETFEQLRAAHRAAHPAARPWVWKDPRACVTMPLWNEALPGRHVTALVLRDPSEIADSLAARNGMDRPYALALWERYLSSAIEHLDGAAVWVCRYRDLLDDPPRWAEEACAVLRSCGLDVELGADAVDNISSFVTHGLRHHMHRSTMGDGGLTERQHRLWRWLDSSVGYHEHFSTASLGSTPFDADSHALDTPRRLFGETGARDRAEGIESISTAADTE